MRRDSAQFDRLVEKCSQGMAVSGAADALGIPLRTAQRWAGLPEFKAEVRRVRGAMQDETVGLLVKASATAVATLIMMMGHKQSEAGRIRAARSILTALIHVQSHADLSERINELTERLDQAERTRPRLRGQRG